MAVSVSKAGPYYTSGPIKFSDLRRDFRASVRKATSSGSETTNPSLNTGAISSSELLRNTTTTQTGPVVPDCTENTGISVSNNWKLSQFRDSIKYYYVTESGTETNFDIGGQDWNTNLEKNINKIVFIDGTCGSTVVSSPSAQLNTTAYNLAVDVYGSILACGGGGGGTGGTAPAISGETGGDALSLTSTSGNNITVVVRPSAQIYGGGGGGEKGKTGSNGSSAQCRQETYVQSGCQQGNTVGCPGGWNQYQSGNWCCEWRRGCNASIWWVRCETQSNTSTPQGGVGGNGGNGRGYNNPINLDGSGVDISLKGGGGGPQQCPSCPGGTQQSGGSCSQAGETGATGGEWGFVGSNTTNSGDGGNPGRAISGSNYSVSGTINASTLKGLYNP